MTITSAVDTSGRKSSRGVPAYRLEACLVRLRDNATVWCNDLSTTDKLTYNSLNPEAFLYRDIYILSEPFTTDSEFLRHHVTSEPHTWVIKLHGHPVLKVPHCRIQGTARAYQLRYKSKFELIRISSTDDPNSMFVVGVCLYSSLLKMLLSGDTFCSRTDEEEKDGEVRAITQLASEICEKYLCNMRRHETNALEMFRASREKRISRARSEMMSSHAGKTGFSLLVARMRLSVLCNDNEHKCDAAEKEPYTHELMVVPHLINVERDVVVPMFCFPLPPTLLSTMLLRCRVEVHFVSIPVNDENVIDIYRRISHDDENRYRQQLIAKTNTALDVPFTLASRKKSGATTAACDFLVTLPSRHHHHGCTDVRRTDPSSTDLSSRWERSFDLKPCAKESDPRSAVPWCYLTIPPLDETCRLLNEQTREEGSATTTRLRLNFTNAMLSPPTRLFSHDEDKKPVFIINGSFANTAKQELRLWDIDYKISKLAREKAAPTTRLLSEEERSLGSEENEDAFQHHCAEDALLLVVQWGAGCKCPSDITFVERVTFLFRLKYGQNFAQSLLLSWLANNTDLTYIVHRLPLENGNDARREKFLERVVANNKERYDVLSDFQRALLRAARYESPEMFAFLLRNLEMVTEKHHHDVERGKTGTWIQEALNGALICACFNGNLPVVDYLLFCQKRCVFPPRFVRTAFVSAAENLKVDTLYALVEYIRAQPRDNTYIREIRGAKLSCFATLCSLYAPGLKEVEDVKKMLLTV